MPTNLDPFKIPFIDLRRSYADLREELMRAVDETGRSGIYILGERVEELEATLEKFLKAKNVVTVGNGSDAIFLSLKALSIGPGDEVITAANSFIASAWAIKATGASPVLVDVDESFNINPHEFELAITSNTKAVIPVHLAGIPANMPKIIDIAQKHKIAVIEDSAQAIGSKLSGKHVGTFGDFGTFSMHPLKNLSVMGDGGFLTFASSDYAEIIRLLRNHGLRDRNNAAIWGYNSRLDEIQAAIALVKLKRIEDWKSRVQEISARYRDGLQDSGVGFPKQPNDCDIFLHNFMIIVDNANEFIRAMQSDGIECKTHYPIPIHLQECARELGYQLGDFPVSEMQSKKSVSLPIYPELTDFEVDQVIKSILLFQARKGL